MNLNLTESQQLSLSPQMLQFVRILQMDAQELREFVEAECAGNPLLELRPDAYAPDSLGHSRSYWTSSGREAADPHSGLIHSLPAPGETLQESLKTQLQTLKLPPHELAAAAFIADCLDEDGYLDVPLEFIARQHRMSEEQALELLRIIQSLEPCGVGARDIRECLLLQLERRGQGASLAARLAGEYLDLLSRNRLDAISRKLGAPIGEIKAAYAVIQSLHPRPGSLYSQCGEPVYIIPDIIIVKSGGDFRAVLREERPPVAINSRYMKLQKESADKETQAYIASMKEQAHWILKCLTDRSRTLLRVANAIISLQRPFFESGPRSLTPMTLQAVADKLGIHESTVSRAVRDKYVECSHGVLEMSSFFSHGLPTDSTSAVTPQQVKRTIRDLIAGENKKKPLSDQQISDLLQQTGIHVARRTVAKYREEMLLPGASGRKQFDD